MPNVVEFRIDDLTGGALADDRDLIHPADYAGACRFVEPELVTPNA